MIASKLSEIAAEVKRLNPYFDEGYSNVFAMAEGYVVRGDKGVAIPVFPNDTLGDYFYLRMPRNWAFSYGDYIADAISGTTVSAQIVLVAYMQRADADKLSANLINTLRTIGPRLKGTIQLVSATAIDEEVLAQELTDLSDEQYNDARMRLGENITLCSVTFNYSQLFPYSNCSDNPCSC